MSGPSQEAYDDARRVVEAHEADAAMLAVRAAYPVIRRDVIAEVVTMLRGCTKTEAGAAAAIQVELWAKEQDA